MTEAVQVVCSRHDHGIGCTVVYPDGRMLLVDGQWESIEAAERAVGAYHSHLAALREAQVDELAYRIARAYRDRRITQRRSLMDAARAMGVTPATLSAWERGRAEPTPEQRAAWVAWLEGGDDGSV